MAAKRVTVSIINASELSFIGPQLERVPERERDRILVWPRRGVRGGPPLINSPITCSNPCQNPIHSVVYIYCIPGAGKAREGQGGNTLHKRRTGTQGGKIEGKSRTWRED